MTWLMEDLKMMIDHNYILLIFFIRDRVDGEIYEITICKTKQLTFAVSFDRMIFKIWYE